MLIAALLRKISTVENRPNPAMVTPGPFNVSDPFRVECLTMNGSAVVETPVPLMTLTLWLVVTLAFDRTLTKNTTTLSPRGFTTESILWLLVRRNARIALAEEETVR